MQCLKLLQMPCLKMPCLKMLRDAYVAWAVARRTKAYVQDATCRMLLVGWGMVHDGFGFVSGVVGRW